MIRSCDEGGPGLPQWLPPGGCPYRGIVKSFHRPPVYRPSRLVPRVSASIVMLLLSMVCGPSGLSVSPVAQTSAAETGAVETAEAEKAVAQSSTAGTSTSRQAQQSPIKIGIVTREPDDDEGGCSLQLPGAGRSGKRRIVFNSSYENGDEHRDCAFMNIDGRDIKLKRIYSKWPPGGDDKVGNRGVQIYASGDTRVEVDWVVTHLCGPR